MKNSLYIGKIAGINIFLHWTFPIIILWIIFSNLRRGLNAEQVTWSVVFILILAIDAYFQIQTIKTLVNNGFQVLDTNVALE